MKTAKKTRGRPAKLKGGPVGGRLSGTRTFRVRGGMDESLKRSAERAGRSLSEEIEARLERSFYLDAVLSTVQGEGARLFSALATAVMVTRKMETDVLRVVIGIIIDAFDAPPGMWNWRTALNFDDSLEPSDPEATGKVLAGLVLSNFGFSVPHFRGGKFITEALQVGEEK
jgi:hypothetical protein